MKVESVESPKPCRTSQGRVPKSKLHESRSSPQIHATCALCVCRSGFAFSRCRPTTTRSSATSRPTPCGRFRRLAPRTRRPGARDLQNSTAQPEALLAGTCWKATWLICFVTAGREVHGPCEVPPTCSQHADQALAEG